MGTYIIHFDDKPWEDLDDEQYYRCKEIPWFSTTKTTISRLTPCTEPDLDAVKKEAYQQGHKDGYNKHDTEKIRKQGYDKGLDDIGNALRLLLFQYSNYTLQTIFGYDTARAVVEHFEGSEIVARIRCYEGGVKQDAETIRKEAYAEGYKEGMQLSIDDAKLKESYQQGLSDAWEAARKIGSNSMCSLEEMGFDFSQCAVSDYNPSWFVVKNYSASEVIEKIRKYEQEKQFCVGDEFENEYGKRFVITKMDGTEIDRYIDDEGKTYCMIAKYRVMRKTGRHFPEIAKVLAKMKETDNG